MKKGLKNKDSIKQTVLSVGKIKSLEGFNFQYSTPTFCVEQKLFFRTWNQLVGQADELIWTIMNKQTKFLSVHKTNSFNK